MFGLYRFLLALAVVLSHHGLIVLGFNPGQWAVICFYVLSGYLMNCQYEKLAPIGGVRAFYLDRFLRIFPVYAAVVLIATCYNPVSWTDFVLNFTLLPTNLYGFLGIPLLIALSWSLACEIQFYLLVPLLVTASTRVLRWLVAGSVIVSGFSLFLPYHWMWTYVLLPGVLFNFISGILINRREWATLRLIALALFGLWSVLMLTKLAGMDLRGGIQINVYTGYLLAVPATAFLAQFSNKYRWDRWIGLFSYPLFLVHPIVTDLTQKYHRFTDLAPYLALSLTAAGALLLLVEKPFDRVRYRMRKKKPRPVIAGQPA